MGRSPFFTTPLHMHSNERVERFPSHLLSHLDFGSQKSNFEEMCDIFFSKRTSLSWSQVCSFDVLCEKDGNFSQGKYIFGTQMENGKKCSL